MKVRTQVLVDLPGDQWHRVTMRMSWYFRSGQWHHLPEPVFLAFGGEPPTRDAWDQARKWVNAQRRADTVRDQRLLEAKRKAERRAYMARYMRDRRAKARSAHA